MHVSLLHILVHIRVAGFLLDLSSHPGQSSSIHEHTHNASLDLQRKFWLDLGKQGKRVFLFRLRRLPGQGELFSKTVSWGVHSAPSGFTAMNTSGLVSTDLSNGQELTKVDALPFPLSNPPPPFPLTCVDDPRQVLEGSVWPIVPVACTTRCSDACCSTKRAQPVSLCDATHHDT